MTWYTTFKKYWNLMILGSRQGSEKTHIGIYAEAAPKKIEIVPTRNGRGNGIKFISEKKLKCIMFIIPNSANKT